METVSENTPRRKRGRPKSTARMFSDRLINFGIPIEGTERTKVNYALSMLFIRLIIKASQSEQTAMIGCTWSELEGKHGGKYPPGLKTASTEIGRYLDGIGNTEENGNKTYNLVLAARKAGKEWTSIKSFFRGHRLGERHGNALSLFAHLARAYDDYIRRFPATTQQARIGSIENLLDAVENPCE